MQDEFTKRYRYCMKEGTLTRAQFFCVG